MLEMQVATIGLIQKFVDSAVSSLIKGLKDKYVEGFQQRLKNPELRTTTLKIIWAISVLLLIITTASILLIFYHLVESPKWGIGISVFIWSVYLGVTTLIFLPGRFIGTLFGCFIGISISEIGDAAGLISKTKDAVTSITTEIGILIVEGGGTPDPFIYWMVWLFVAVFTLLCLPSFFMDK